MSPSWVSELELDHQLRAIATAAELAAGVLLVRAIAAAAGLAVTCSWSSFDHQLRAIAAEPMRRVSRAGGAPAR